MTDRELFERMTTLYTRYKDALGEYEIGKALLVRDEATELLAKNWEQVNSALERAAQPMSYAAEQEDADRMSAPHPLDTCYCGDYRKDHEDGIGACIFSVGSRGDGHSGAGECNQFRLHQLYIETPKALDEQEGA